MNIDIIDLELVGGCNYKCQMCPHTSPGREADFIKALPWNVFTKIIDEAVDLGVKSIRLHGSGEPTLYKKLPEAVAYCHSRGLKTLITTNGARLTKSLSDKLIESGLDQLTVSATGYDRETYRQWMGINNFDLVRENVRYYVQNTEKICNLYHLIIDPEQLNYEIEQYQENWINHTGADYEIWQMHNWSGNLKEIKFQRKKEQQRSCGRMFKPVLEVRAGGLNGQYGAVVSCCMILGNDSAAVLGHLDKNSIFDVWTGEKYRELREKHAEGKWNEIDYCQGCDQLYDRPESLVATSLKNRIYSEIKEIQRSEKALINQ